MKYLRYVLKTLLIILVSIILFAFLLLGFQNKDELSYYLFGEYPAQGEYWISFKENDYGHSTTVYYRQYIYTDEEIDTSNLIIYPELINDIAFYIDKEDIYDSEKIRKILLQNGLASINDESKATEMEIEYQQQAQENGDGYWRQQDSISISSTGQEKDKLTILDIINWMIVFVRSKIYFILKIFLGILGAGAAVGGLIRFFRRNNIDVIFGGEISSGKTTIILRLKKPRVTETELLRITNTKKKVIEKGERIAVGKKDIFLYLIDHSGQQYAQIFDSINKPFFRNPCRMLIVTIALGSGEKTDGHTDLLDMDYLNSEISKAVQLLSIVSESTTVKSLDKVIVFINKCDLIYKSEEELFYDSNRKLINLLKKSTDFLLLEDLMERDKNIEMIYGSALKGWGIDQIEDIIQEIV